jgi:hypothetical protein
MSEHKLRPDEVKHSFQNQPIVSSMVRTDDWDSTYDNWFSFSSTELRRIGADILAQDAIVQYNSFYVGTPYIQIDHTNVKWREASFGFFATHGQDCRYFFLPLFIGFTLVLFEGQLPLCRFRVLYNESAPESKAMVDE